MDAFCHFFNLFTSLAPEKKIYIAFRVSVIVYQAKLDTKITLKYHSIISWNPAMYESVRLQKNLLSGWLIYFLNI